MPVSPDPARIKAQLGLRLRQLRERADRSTYEAAEALGCRQPKISKIENGNQGVKPDEVRTLGKLYGASAKELAQLVGLAERLPRRTRARSVYRDSVPDWFERFLALESNASDIRSYAVEVMPGLLQTEDYARALILAWEPEADRRVVEQQVANRMRRQAVLRRAKRPLRLDLVLSESALRRQQASAVVMRDQVRHLTDVSTWDNVSLRVLPFGPPNRIAATSSFMLLRLEEPDLERVYLEDLFGATYLKKPEEVTQYGVAFGKLRSASLSEPESRDLIAKLAQGRP